jgi:hypothetical protein
LAAPDAANTGQCTTGRALSWLGTESLRRYTHRAEYWHQMMCRQLTYVEHLAPFPITLGFKMKIQLTFSAEQLTIMAETLCNYRVHTRLDKETSAKCYNDPVWKELSNIIDLAELEVIDGHKRTARYKIINQ